MSGQNIKRRKLSDYILDPANPNKGTSRGVSMLESSVQNFGAARSGVADKDGIIRAGNHTAEQLMAAGIEDVIEVETDGKTWVVVKRLDMDKTTGKRYAIADNRTGQLIDWDTDVLAGLVNEGVDLSGMWTANELTALLGSVPDVPSQSDDAPPHALVCPHCGEVFEP